MRVIAVCLAALVVLAAVPVRTSARSAPVPEAQIAAIARDALDLLRDHRVKHVRVVRTTWVDANRILQPGSFSEPNPGRARVYGLVMRGLCYCIGSPTSDTRAVWTAIWEPGRDVSTYIGGNHLPRGMATLGHFVSISTAGPTVSPDVLAVQPEAGIGPVRIGQPTGAVEHALEPAIERSGPSARYAFGPIDLRVRANSHGRINALMMPSWSSSATIAGHPLSEGYTRLHAELPDWAATDCGPTQFGRTRVLVHRAAGSFWTWIEFADDQFHELTIARANADPCKEDLLFL